MLESFYYLQHVYTSFKLNVAVYKNLHLEFLTKKGLVTRTQCENAIMPYSSRAYCLFYACGMILRYVRSG